MKASVKLGAIAVALLAASAASASTTVLDGKGFDIVYDSGATPFSTSTVLPFSLSADGKGIIFAVSSLVANGSDAYSDLSFSIVADKGYAFSGLSLNAAGTYTLARDTANSTYAGLVSSVSALGSTAAPSFASDDVTKTVTKGKLITVGSWSLSNSYNSASLAGASALNFSTTILLGGSLPNSSGLATIKATDYTLSVATAPVPEPGEWAMMLAGLGMLGTIIGRRSRS